MNKRTIVTGVGAAILLAGSAAGVAVATGAGIDRGDDGDGGLTGQQADRAIKAALGYTHGGTANSVERDSENGATWEVEVTKADGQTVDVRLDDRYQLVVIEGDSENDG